MKYRKKDDLLLSSNMVRKPLKEKLKAINSSINNCILYLEGLKSIKIDLLYEKELKCYRIKDVTNNLEEGRYYKGIIKKENVIHPIEVEIEMGDDKIQDFINLFENYKNINKKRVVVESNKEENKKKIELPDNYKKLIENKKKEKSILEYNIPDNYKKLILDRYKK